jgi:hypothetical protein
MKRIAKIAALTLGLVALGGLALGFRPLAEFQAAVHAADDHVLTFDIAADCRTLAGGFSNPAELFMLSGKIFPAGTLPSGPTTFYPTDAVNGVNPIGTWTIRGRTSPIPSSLAALYLAAPIAFGTEYLVLDNFGTLTYESYQLPSGVVLSSITGGTGRFNSAAGSAQANPGFGTNPTGCPNGHVTFTFQPGTVRGALND